MKINIKSIQESYKLISPYIKNTPLEFNKRLSDKYNCNVYLKREDLQDVRSFKIRGALNKILSIDLSNDQSVVCASAGNHAQGVAYTCNLLDTQCDIFVPENTPLQKIKKIKKFTNDKINIHLSGSTFDQCLIESKKFSKNNNSLFVHPFDDEKIIEGQGTIGIELLDNFNPDYVLSCIGGGGLISGVGGYIKEIHPECKIIGCEPEKANSMYQSIKKGSVYQMENFDTFVDGASVGKVGNITFKYAQNYIDEIMCISNGELCNDMLDLYQEDGIIVEPAGALSVSGLKRITSKTSNTNIVCILSGGNNDVTRYPEIIEHSLVYQGLKHYFIISFNQIPGELRRFVDKVLCKGSDITRFEYIKKTNKDFGNVLIGIQIQDKNDINTISENMLKHNFNYKKITSDELIYSFLI